MCVFRISLLLLFSLTCSTSSGEEWTRFRGPNGTGVSEDGASTPVEWSPSKNLHWKAVLPGPGVSSPIVVQDRVFVTSYSGYGESRQEQGEMERLVRHLTCFDAKTGEQRWTKAVPAVQPEDEYSGAGIPAHGYASHTPVSDGENVYVFFGKSGALAFEMDGAELWQTNVGTESDPWRWGSASSPVLYKDLLIVTASAESQALVAIDKVTGEEKWRQEAAGFDGTWGTPAFVDVDERTELVMAVPSEIWGFNPDNGKLRWFCISGETEQIQTSVVVDDGIVYAIAGRGGGSIAVRAGGKGEVTDTHVNWSGRDSARFGSPILYQDRLYLVADNIVICIDAATGERIEQIRLGGGDAGADEGDANRRGGPGANRRGPGGGGGVGRFGTMDFASPVIANGKLYYLTGTGEMFVFQLGDKLEQVAVNQVTEDSETFGGTPAISDGRLYFRSDKHLYCVAPE